MVTNTTGAGIPRHGTHEHHMADAEGVALALEHLHQSGVREARLGLVRYRAPAAGDGADTPEVELPPRPLPVRAGYALITR